MFRTCSTATVAHVRQAALEVIKILPWQANLEVSIYALVKLNLSRIPYS